ANAGFDVQDRNHPDGSNSRLIGVRGPIVVVGWGIDIHGNVAPNVDNYMQRSDKWKAGPVDMLWDDIRGVWSVNTRMLGKPDVDIGPNGSGYATIWDGAAST